MTNNRRDFSIVAIVGAAMATTVALIVAFGVRVNLTHSQPTGLYVQSRAPIARGALVSVCLDDRAPAVTVAIVRHYFPSGSCPGGIAPSLKNVEAMPGDRVEFKADAVLVNGRPIARTARLAKDRLGMRLPAPGPGVQVVPPGEVLLLATHSPLSFDGRYYGFMPIGSIQSPMRALVTTEP